MKTAALLFISFLSVLFHPNAFGSEKKKSTSRKDKPRCSSLLVAEQETHFRDIWRSFHDFDGEKNVDLIVPRFLSSLPPIHARLKSYPFSLKAFLTQPEAEYKGPSKNEQEFQELFTLFGRWWQQQLDRRNKFLSAYFGSQERSVAMVQAFLGSNPGYTPEMVNALVNRVTNMRSARELEQTAHEYLSSNYLSTNNPALRDRVEMWRTFFKWILAEFTVNGTETSTAAVSSPAPAFEDTSRAKRKKMLEKATEILAAHSIASQALNDFVVDYWTRRFYGPHTVSLLLGNPWQEPSPSEIAQVRELVAQITRRGLRILYDADSSLAPVIASTAGAAALGITSQSQRKVGELASANIVTMVNPYLKLRAFSKGIGRVVVAGLGSVTGMGALFDEGVDMYFELMEPASRCFDRFERDHLWGRLKRAFAVNHVTQMLNYINAVTISDFSKSTFSPFEMSSALSEISSYSLEQMIEQSLRYQSGVEAITNLKSHRVAVFGASREFAVYENDVFFTSQRLAKNGFAVLTGGAGGLMRVANAGAFSVGGVSIGIPLKGKESLFLEKKVASEVHTLTFPTESYEERIPLLLYGTELILVAPGSAGTRKEVAASLITLGGEKSSNRELIFLGVGFFDSMVSDLKQLNLPTEFTRRVSVLRLSSEIDPVIERLRFDSGK